MLSTRHHTKISCFVFVAMLFAVVPSRAAIIVQSHWRMGEEAGDTDGRLDSVGTRHFSVASGPTEFNVNVAPSTNGSTRAVNARAGTPAGRAGFFGPNFSSFMPADNWGFEMWVRSANTTQSISISLQGNPTVNGHLKFEQLGANWTASYHNLGWIGGTNGTGQPVTAEQWTHLAIVRNAGISSLYIDGIAQAGTSNFAPVWGSSLHLGVMPGGATGWNGDFDEVRVFTFNPGEFNAATDLLVVPEPGTASILGLGMLALLGFARRRRVAGVVAYSRSPQHV